MKRVLIVADDLTGANANCSLMKKIGLRAVSFLGTNANEVPNDIEVIATTTDSRAMTKDQARNAVIERSQIFKDIEISLYSKRIDSTLRGNLGSELSTYQRVVDKDRIAICVPAYPDSGRIVVDGTMYVNGNLLMNTDAGKDPKMPVVSNKVIENFSKDYEGKIKEIKIEDVEKGKDHIRNLILEYKDDYDLLIFDSLINEHIEEIACAVIDSGIDHISVDPGPFTKELTSLMYKQSSISTKAMAIIGSVTKITIEQLHRLKEKYNYYQISVNPDKLLSMNTIQEEIDRCKAESDANIDKVDLLIITTTPDDISGRLDLNEMSKTIGISVDDISLIISRGLANISKRILENTESISGIFSSGGDITVALAEELLSMGIEIKDEVIPLAAYGRLLGGLRPGLKIVSKGGMVGGPDAMVKCVEQVLKLED